MIMESVGQSHNHNQPFPTWELVGRAVSRALFDQENCLLLKSTMVLHHKDYLLFERDVSLKPSPLVPHAGSVVEVYFERLSGSSTWECYWKIARPVVVRHVQSCKHIIITLRDGRTPF